jgi:hypothetical protein
MFMALSTYGENHCQCSKSLENKREKERHKRRRDGEWVLKGRRRKREKGGGT